MGYLVRTFSKDKRNTIIGTAIIIFVYRSMPSPGAGLGWYEIDVLKFDQTFLAYLAVNASFITLLDFLQKPYYKLFISQTICNNINLSGSLYLPSLMYIMVFKISLVQ